MCSADCSSMNSACLKHFNFYKLNLIKPAFVWPLTQVSNFEFIICFSHRAEWPKDHFIPPYVPRFRNGWEPPLLNFMGAPKEQELNHLAESVANVAEQQRKQEMKRLSSEVSYCKSVLLIS